MQAIAQSLDIDTTYFGDAFADPTMLFRIFNYPPHDTQFGESSQAVGEHTDYGYVTILSQDTCGGLQVRGRGGGWVDAPYKEDTFVINLGDALEHSTGGLLRATPHRQAHPPCPPTPLPCHMSTLPLPSPPPACMHCSAAASRQCLRGYSDFIHTPHELIF
jgi:isopenicillin N synthase-like dioxygenase